ncbi:hypothetical protein RCL_jg18364.t1 [Rhizophagus clarus]|uniref:Uncharacterized protein n=1 Tax=Rhizophagus clarus TaxID=94130 RepID=A0A8H3QNG6_9GLOM|nr:hypothetical protein RCL_jg18364.t1 [Rhizophagus clarus]
MDNICACDIYILDDSICIYILACISYNNMLRDLLSGSGSAFGTGTGSGAANMYHCYEYNKEQEKAIEFHF